MYIECKETEGCYRHTQNPRLFPACSKRMFCSWHVACFWSFCMSHKLSACSQLKPLVKSQNWVFFSSLMYFPDLGSLWVNQQTYTGSIRYDYWLFDVYATGPSWCMVWCWLVLWHQLGPCVGHTNRLTLWFWRITILISNIILIMLITL